MRAEGDFLRLENLHKSFGAQPVVADLQMVVRRGEAITLLGPSGCGKTTLLKLIAGLVAADRGRILLDGRDLTRVPPNRRNLGVVFQNYALFPHLTVAQNVAFGLRARGQRGGAIRGHVAQKLAMVQMSEHADRPVTALSGGQQQRVAVARALAIEPDLVLLDEPFSALDRKLRETLQVELRQLLRRLGITAIFVTHDQEEALIMSDRLAVMSHGRIEQFADPATVYARPSSLFVLEFVGQSTRIEGRVVDVGQPGIVGVETQLGLLRAEGRMAAGQKAVLGVRPENVGVNHPPRDGDVAVRARLTEATLLGSRWLLRFDAPGALELIAEVPANSHLPPGDADVTLSWPLSASLAFVLSH